MMIPLTIFKKYLQEAHRAAVLVGPGAASYQHRRGSLCKHGRVTRSSGCWFEID